MNSIQIIYRKDVPIKIQIVQLKATLVQSGVILGKDFTLEIAYVVTQMETLIKFYDRKRLSGRFYSNVKTLELIISDENKYYLNYELCKNKLEIITSGFENSSNNSNKKVYMFKLLFLHINILFQAYIIQQNQTGVVESRLPKVIPTNKIKLYKQKYTELTNRLLETPDISAKDRNRYKASLSYYRKKLKSTKESLINLTG